MGESGRPFESLSLTGWSVFVLIRNSVAGFPGLRRRALTDPLGFRLPQARTLPKSANTQGPGGLPVRPGRLRCRRLNSPIADSKQGRENSGHSSSRKTSSEQATCQSR